MIYFRIKIDQFDGDKKNDYGNDKTMELYSQVVADIDVKAVIDAVNKKATGAAAVPEVQS